MCEVQYLEMTVTNQDLKSSIFWDITLCSPLKINRQFGGSCCFPLQDEEYAKQETSVQQVVSKFDS
jgi:hypothetical protein